MSLPDNLTTVQLAENGFKIIGEGKAKHDRYNSFRHQCQVCGLWCKQLNRRQEWQGRMCCRKCFVQPRDYITQINTNL